MREGSETKRKRKRGEERGWHTKEERGRWREREGEIEREGERVSE